MASETFGADPRIIGALAVIVTRDPPAIAILEVAEASLSVLSFGLCAK
jgi:hypothetical protein